MNTRQIGFLITALIVAVLIVIFVRSRPRVVLVSSPTSLIVTESIAASGRLRGTTESNIGAQNSGRVAAILVHEGDKVQANQIIARLDDSVLQAQVAQAQVALYTAQGQLAQSEAAIGSARAELARASRPPLNADVTRLRADVNQSNAVNRAKLIAARQKAVSAYQRYQEAKNGTRKEEVEQADILVKQAETNLIQYERDWKRQQSLYTKGFIARSVAEQSETTYLVGKQNLDNTKAKLQQLRTGSRTEQVAQAQADYRAAQADVVSAEAAVSGASVSGEAQIASLLSSPRKEDIIVAQEKLAESMRSRDVSQDRVAEAEIALMLAKRRLRETVVTVPFAGTVTSVVTEVGAVTGPNTPLIRLVRTGTPEIRIDLDESNLGKLRVGQKAVVTNDAFPDARFTATVHAIGAQVDTDRGTVEVRLTPQNTPDWVRPGQTFTVNIITEVGKPRLVVPLTAVHTVSGVSSLLLVENGKIVQKTIKTLALSQGGVPVLEGINASSLVVLQPEGLQEGDTVIAKRSF